MIGLRLEIGYGGAQPLYNPATQFAAGGLGLWYDPSDYATLSQDSAGATPVTASGQTVGRMLDKSGRGNTYSQATAPARPLTATSGAILSLAFDGVDDGGATGAITLSANMDCFIAIRRATTASIVLVHAANNGNLYFGATVVGGAALATANSGTPTYAVNGVLLNGGAINTTSGQFDAALPIGAWQVVEVRNLNVLAWPALFIAGYTSFSMNGDFGGMILAPAGDAATRQNNRRNLGAKVGLTLP